MRETQRKTERQTPVYKQLCVITLHSDCPSPSHTALITLIANPLAADAGLSAYPVTLMSGRQKERRRRGDRGREKEREREGGTINR